jgi:hypothetical protein
MTITKGKYKTKWQARTCQSSQDGSQSCSDNQRKTCTFSTLNSETVKYTVDFRQKNSPHKTSGAQDSKQQTEISLQH